MPHARRRLLVLAALTLALTASAAACGGGGEEAATEPAEATTATEQPTDGATGGDAERGATVFEEAGCGNCHTLEAAGSSGAVGPNLDEAQPPFEHVVDLVTNGSGAMPAFGDGTLDEQQIQDVAAYVVQATSG